MTGSAMSPESITTIAISDPGKCSSGTERRVQHSSAARQKEGPDRASKTRIGDEQAAFPCHCFDVLAMREKSGSLQASPQPRRRWPPRTPVPRVSVRSEPEERYREESGALFRPCRLRPAQSARRGERILRQD